MEVFMEYLITIETFEKGLINWTQTLKGMVQVMMTAPGKNFVLKGSLKE